MSADILGTSSDQCRSMVHYSFTSTETRRLVRADNPGRPPRLSHSSWTMTRTGLLKIFPNVCNCFVFLRGAIWALINSLVRWSETTQWHLLHVTLGYQGRPTPYNAVRWQDVPLNGLWSSKQLVSPVRVMIKYRNSSLLFTLWSSTATRHYCSRYDQVPQLVTPVGVMIKYRNSSLLLALWSSTVTRHSCWRYDQVPQLVTTVGVMIKYRNSSLLLALWSSTTTRHSCWRYDQVLTAHPVSKAIIFKIHDVPWKLIYYTRRARSFMPQVCGILTKTQHVSRVKIANASAYREYSHLGYSVMAHCSSLHLIWRRPASVQNSTYIQTHDKWLKLKAF